MHTMAEIEALAKAFSSARDALSERVQVMRDEVEKARRMRIQGVKNSLARFAETHDALLAAINESKALFDKPKSRTLHGVRVGWKKNKGTIEYADEAATVAAIERKFSSDKAGTLVRTKKTLIAAAIEQLTGAELKAIGVTVGNDTEQPFVKPVGDDIDKLTRALLKDAAIDEEALP